MHFNYEKCKNVQEHIFIKNQASKKVFLLKCTHILPNHQTKPILHFVLVKIVIQKTYNIHLRFLRNIVLNVHNISAPRFRCLLYEKHTFFPQAYSN